MTHWRFQSRLRSSTGTAASCRLPVGLRAAAFRHDAGCMQSATASRSSLRCNGRWNYCCFLKPAGQSVSAPRPKQSLDLRNADARYGLLTGRWAGNHVERLLFDLLSGSSRHVSAVHQFRSIPDIDRSQCKQCPKQIGKPHPQIWRAIEAFSLALVYPIRLTVLKVKSVNILWSRLSVNNNEIRNL